VPAVPPTSCTTGVSNVALGGGTRLFAVKIFDEMDPVFLCPLFLADKIGA